MTYELYYSNRGYDFQPLLGKCMRTPWRMLCHHLLLETEVFFAAISGDPMWIL